ncbi:MAG: 3-dehydroquinate dehydratase [Bacteroidetes bacterium]|nr:3-dehydroquinate dehydratase [Bacteroidota bacterium]
MKILILNGPNLNLVGTREKSVYGEKDFDSFLETLKDQNQDIDIDYYQSNLEGEIINKMHEVGFSFDGIIFNGGGYTHTSVAIADAIAAITTPVLEVHITNLYAREEYRHLSLTGKNCVGVITGLGLESYELAIRHFSRHL